MHFISYQNSICTANGHGKCRRLSTSCALNEDNAPTTHGIPFSHGKQRPKPQQCEKGRHIAPTRR